MVKGLLALFFRVFKSSGPSPNTPFITSTNDGNNHNKQHNQSKNKSALKIGVGLFQDTSGHMKNNQGGFIGVGSIGSLEHFNMMEPKGLWIWKKYTEIIP